LNFERHLFKDESEMENETKIGLLGDVIKSRAFVDQSELFNSIQEGLSWLNEHLESNQPAQLMTGDEFQVAYDDVPSALLASTLISLRLADTCRFRFGIGAGTIISDHQYSPAAQSGTAWWRAREAIDAIKGIQKSATRWPSTLNTLFIGEGIAEDHYINAFLICRDQILNRLDSKDARITLGLFLNESQSDVSRELKISQPTISSRQRANGPSALLRAHESLSRLLENP